MERSRFCGACFSSGRVIFPSNRVRITGQGDRCILDERPLSHACRSCDAAAPTVRFLPFECAETTFGLGTVQAQRMTGRSAQRTVNRTRPAGRDMWDKNGSFGRCSKSIDSDRRAALSVIWMRLDHGLNIGPYFWFGGAPGKPLPAISGYPNALRPTRNKEGFRPLRANHHEVPSSVFTQRDSLIEVLENLFGSFEKEGAGAPL